MSSTNRSGSELEAVLRTCLRRQGLRRGARVLVAVSGGPDSTAMLHALHELHAPRELRALDRLPGRSGLELVCAYLDHGLRGAEERARERLLVERLCASLQLPLVVRRVSPGSLERRARREHRSLEEAARICRYAFLRRTARALGCALIAVGHTADDQAETLLMRLLQGAGPEALGGIPERRGEILRPLLGCSRAAVLRYLARCGLPFHLDSSNSSPVYLRNAVRLRLLPLLEQTVPGFRGSLARLAGQFRQVGELLEEQASIRLPWRPARGCLVVGYEQFVAAPPLLRAASLRLQMRRLGLAGGKVPQRFLAPAVESAGPGGSAVLLAGYGLRLARSGESLVLSRHIVGEGEKGYFILGRRGERFVVPAAGLVFEFRDQTAPLLVRSHRPGDLIRVERGVKSVDKMLSEWRVPAAERWKVPVVEDDRGILAVLGGTFGVPDRLRRDAPGQLGLLVHAGERESE